MKRLSLLFLIMAVLLLAACTVQIQPTSSPAAPDAPVQVDSVMTEETAPIAEFKPNGAGGIPVVTLMNATYSGIYDEPITLTNGLYEGEPLVEGDPSRPVVEYIDGVELNGDLNGDGVNDAIVFLMKRGGGSGAFTYVSAQLNEDGQPVDAGAVWIEDRIGVRAATVEHGQVVLNIILQGPGDGACCGSHKARKTYALQDEQLVETTVENDELVKVSGADLNGTSWTLLELNEEQRALTDSVVTLSFWDGQFTGFGGCNSYSGKFSLSDDNPFVMTTGLIAATQKSCLESIVAQEKAYFIVFDNVARWSYVFGELALYYADGQNGESRLLFTPQMAE